MQLDTLRFIEPLLFAVCMAHLNANDNIPTPLLLVMRYCGNAMPTPGYSQLPVEKNYNNPIQFMVLGPPSKLGQGTLECRSTLWPWPSWIGGLFFP